MFTVSWCPLCGAGIAFEELRKGPDRFTDIVAGKHVETFFGEANSTATIVAEDGKELPTVMLYWFAWTAFHPDAEIHTAE